LALIGFGSLGETVVRACFKTGVATATGCLIVERDEQRLQQAAALYRCRCRALPNEDISEAQLIVLVVKPQDAEALCRALSPHLIPQQTVLSLMAGTSTNRLREWLGHPLVARAMPNLPARLNDGVSVVYLPPSLSSDERGHIEAVLSALGSVVAVADEELVDSATAISGTGPAYFLSLIEELEAVAVELGFSEVEAAQLVRTTARGTARMVLETETSPRALRSAVTSPGGTTEAAFAYLDSVKWAELFKEGVRRAFKRAGELGGKR
jgi:pyrroline-5-carboxylate reductase